MVDVSPEVASLDRVLTRLALTEEDNLEKARGHFAHIKLISGKCRAEPACRAKPGDVSAGFFEFAHDIVAERPLCC